MFRVRMMPGQTPYTPEEQKKLNHLVNEAAAGDPGERNERTTMTKAQKEVAAITDLACMLGRESKSPKHIVVQNAIELWRLARLIKRLAIVECNRELTDIETRNLHTYKRQVDTLTHELGLVCDWATDPRGPSIKIEVTDPWNRNSFGGDNIYGISGEV